MARGGHHRRVRFEIRARTPDHFNLLLEQHDH
jgi:hypothetical protein